MSWQVIEGAACSLWLWLLNSSINVLLLTCFCFLKYSGETEDTFIADLSVGLATVSVWVVLLVEALLVT